MPEELLDVVVGAARPRGSPVPPPLPADVRERASAELAAPARREAYARLEPARRSAEWTEALAALEDERAVWSLVSALWHPSADVQLEALAALERLGDERVVPALLPYAEAMAVSISGSEGATIHGLLHERLGRTLSTLTGVQVELSGQDPDRLRDAIARWRRAGAS